MIAEAVQTPATGEDMALFELEARHGMLLEELKLLETRLRRLRTEADLCAMCGGTLKRHVRGGLYGELVMRSCPCTTPQK